MIQKYEFWRRYWSLAIALGLPVIVFLFMDYQSVRAITSIVCMILLVHSWLIQRRYTQNRLVLLCWTFVLLLPMLGAIWLGLNVIRVYTYDYAADYNRHLGDLRRDLYWPVVKIQDLIGDIAIADLFLSALLAVVSLGKRKS
jgi:hypothetical protein